MQKLRLGLLIGSVTLTLKTYALTFPMPEPGSDVIGEVQIIEAVYEDTLASIARKYDVGFYEIVDANPGVDPWIPGEGTKVIIPTQYILPEGPREGIVINLAELRLYFYNKEDNTVTTHPVGIGSEIWPTPVMDEKIIGKQKHPYWRVPKSILREHEAKGERIDEVWPPGPNNPLGDYAMRLSKPGYLIHGTNRPIGIGRRVTHGCIRMFPEDIETLFYKVPVGSPARVIHDPIKIGWNNNKLFIEIHEPLPEYPMNEDDLLYSLMQMLYTVEDKGPGEFSIDWSLVKESAKQTRGLPQQIGQRHIKPVEPEASLSQLQNSPIITIGDLYYLSR